MSSYNPLFAQDQTAWLFEIGQKLRVAYDDIAEPVPPHLTGLLKVLEIAATETSQQSASSARIADQQTREGEFAGRNEAGGLRA
jgi:hypothetical protein